MNLDKEIQELQEMFSISLQLYYDFEDKRHAWYSDQMVKKIELLLSDSSLDPVHIKTVIMEKVYSIYDNKAYVNKQVQYS